jgi:nicotinamidase-related amidase
VNCSAFSVQGARAFSTPTRRYVPPPASRHRTFNAFQGTDLDKQLRNRGIQKLVFAGLTSHTCVEGTGRQATELGYHLTFTNDGVVEFTDEAHQAAIRISYPTFGHEVLTVEEFLGAVR